MSQPSTRVSRLPELQSTSRAALDELMGSTPLAIIALVRDGHPVVFPTGFARVGDQLVVHGSTGSPWMRALADGAQAAVSITTLDAVVVARSGFESSFRYRSAVLFGTFTRVEDADKEPYLTALTNTFIPGRVGELRESTGKELAATMVLVLPIGASNWSLKVSDGWSEDPQSDIEAGVWAGVVPLTTVYGAPQTAPDCPASIPVPDSVLAMANRPLGAGAAE